METELLTLALITHKTRSKKKKREKSERMSKSVLAPQPVVPVECDVPYFKVKSRARVKWYH